MHAHEHGTALQPLLTNSVRQRSARGPNGPNGRSDHEREVDVIDSTAVVERAVMAGLRDVEEGVSGPEEAADDHVGSATLVLDAPAELRSAGHVLGSRIEEVEGAVQVGALQESLLEELGRRVHVKVIGQLGRLRLTQT